MINYCKLSIVEFGPQEHGGNNHHHSSTSLESRPRQRGRPPLKKAKTSMMITKTELINTTYSQATKVLPYEKEHLHFYSLDFNCSQIVPRGKVNTSLIEGIQKNKKKSKKKILNMCQHLNIVDNKNSSGLLELNQYAYPNQSNYCSSPCLSNQPNLNYSSNTSSPLSSDTSSSFSLQDIPKHVDVKQKVIRTSISIKELLN